MLSKLKTTLTQVLLAVLVGILVITQSGFAELANAASTTCDQTTFVKFALAPDGVSTFAITKAPMTWPAARLLATTQGGRLAVITSSNRNSAIFGNFSSGFGTAQVSSYPSKKAWIGIEDPNNIPDWSMPGQTSVIVPSRFSWPDGTSSFSNWATGQPDGYCTTDEMAANPSHICYGENWGAINTDGFWSDEGDHGPTPITLPAIVEWPNTTLDCVKPDTAISTPVVTPLPDSDKGQLWCTNQTQSNLVQCVQTTTGQEICPLDKAVCNESTENPICPTGSTLNTSRDMCQVAPTVTCPSGYTWDSSIDKCVSSPVCAGGTYNATTQRCEKLVQNDCPTGYTYDSSNNVCTAPVSCSGGGTYNAARDRCELTVTTNCASGFTYDSTANLCYIAPACPTGGTYSTTYDKCMQPYSPSCPTGYSWVAARNRCEKAPECPTGTYNSTTNKCESGSTYTATLSGSCAYNVPVYNASNFFGRTGYYSTASQSWPDESGNSTAFTLAGYAPSSACGCSSNFPGSTGPLSFAYPAYDYTNYTSYIEVVDTHGISAGSACVSKVAYPGLIPIVFYSPFTSQNFTLYIAPAAGSYGGTYTCPSGGTLSGSTCSTLVQANPTCTGGNFDGGNDVCWASMTPSCGSGWTYDSTSGQCVQAPTCAISSVLNTSKDRCELAITTSCASSYTYDAANSICYSGAICANGAFVAAKDRCEATVTKNCGTYTWDSTAQKCYQAPTCPQDAAYSLASTIAYSTSINKCISDTQHTCVSGTTYNGLPVEKCEAVPICNLGVYSTVTHGCQIATCPVGTSSCYQVQGDTTLTSSGQPAKYCSPNNCQSNTAGWTSVTDTPTGQNDKNNDGAHDANGNCLGQIYLFNGNDMRCRLYDRNGMLNSYAKLVAQIVLAATGVGAALGAALAVSAGISTTVATAIVNTVINTAVNACIDAATGQFNASSTLISMGISAIGQALPSLGSYLKDNLGSSGLVNSDAIASNIDISPGSLQVDPQFAPAVGTSEGFANLADALQGSGTFLDAAAQQASTPAFYQYLQQLQALTDQYSPAISQGMLGNYSETKCCYPNKLSGGCESSEIQEATEQHNGMCHIVGSYCSSRLLGICMVNKQTSCCFQSQLARIMHEQGRPQLQSFSSGWGSAQSPICRGFTPEEFQALNFSIMDLSEWEKSLNENMSKITPMVQGFINSTGSAAAQSIQSSPAYKAVP